MNSFNKCKEYGITLIPHKEYTKSELEDYIRNYLWNKDHPNETMLLQIEPQLAHSIDELSKTLQEQIVYHIFDILYWKGNSENLLQVVISAEMHFGLHLKKTNRNISNILCNIKIFILC